jgi:hypothetical protein
MPADLIVYILICLVAAGFIRRVGEVFSVYETQAVDSTPESPSGVRLR